MTLKIEGSNQASQRQSDFVDGLVEQISDYFVKFTAENKRVPCNPSSEKVLMFKIEKTLSEDEVVG